MRRLLIGSGVGVVLIVLLIAALPYLTTPTEPNKLDELGTVEMTIKDKLFRLWIADEFKEHQKGLMFVKAEKMTPLVESTERGMVFVFRSPKINGFWMKNTIIPLDIAYIDSKGKVIKTYTMIPLDTRYRQYLPGGSYHYAIEVNAGVFKKIGLKEGDVIAIPSSLHPQRQ